MENIILKYLSAGGDVAIIILAIFLWMIDRRLIILESVVKHLPKRQGDKSD